MVIQKNQNHFIITILLFHLLRHRFFMVPVSLFAPNSKYLHKRSQTVTLTMPHDTDH